MKIAFRHVPFTPAQRAELDEMARAGGYETLWYADGRNAPGGGAEGLRGPDGLLSSGAAAGASRVEMAANGPAAGVDKLCGNIFARDDAVLTNCSGAFGVAIAEYMVTGILMLMRLMPEYASNQQHHVWKCMGSCRSIYGSTITVVGMGDIGSRFAHVAKPWRHRARRAPHIGKEACGL